MPVVINEFEALAAEPAPAQRTPGGDGAGAGLQPDTLGPCAVAAALRILEEQALRAWAH